MNTSSLDALSDYSKLMLYGWLQITVEESDNENDDDDDDDDRAAAASMMAAAIAGASSDTGAGKPSTSQNQTTHTGMWRRVVGLCRKLTEKAHTFLLIRWDEKK